MTAAHHRTIPPEADLGWQQYAACAAGDINPEWFFPNAVPGTDGPIARQRNAAAKAICADCAVQQECLSDALTDRHREGIWGGLTKDERERITGGAA